MACRGDGFKYSALLKTDTAMQVFDTAVGALSQCLAVEPLLVTLVAIDGLKNQNLPLPSPWGLLR